MTNKKTNKKTSKKAAPAKKAAKPKSPKLALPPVVVQTLVSQIEKVEQASETAAVRKGFFAKIKSWF